MADRDAISPAYNPLPPSDYDTERWVQTTPFSPSMDSPTTLVGSPMSPSTEYKGSIAERMKFVSTSSISKEDDTGSQMEGESEREREEREEMRMGWKQRLKARMKRYRALGLMVGFYTVALLLALGHFSFNSALHNKRPGIDTVNQQQASFVGIILTNLAKAVLTTGLGVGYVQVVWYKLRRRWTSARLIDRILSLPWSPEGMFHFGTVLKKAPLEWVFALFCLTVPIVLSLPPTSMKVVMAPLMSYTAPRVVPAVDLGFRNNETWEGLEGGLLFNPLPATYLYYHNKPLVNPSWGAKPRLRHPRHQRHHRPRLQHPPLRPHRAPP
ncbi:hypothetical protein BJ508DRAFT_88673 [Ascobolus immersus RN42]|uniref:Uncharacterized protein n=1 Tax=Ascobolus immersus RN42 TaxID=1160509 RepID=A0A3N4ICP1_ASCIM|nr:hypothetical protein BJ508DRAFT_88673 [Ascobolus immersus RN42]